MRRILVTNDDGVNSEGIRRLAAELADLGEVTIVAPVGESSAIGHALTLNRPLRLDRLDTRIYSVDGTPTDCVNLAIAKVLGGLPDLVVSGINKGYNIGDDVTYSGTVAGAMEGALLGVPAVAVSLCRAPSFDFGQSASAGRVVAEAVLANGGLPPRTFLNVNVPPVPAHGFRTTVQAKRNHVTQVVEGLDPRGRRYFWIKEGQYDWEPHDRSDYQAVRDGWISVTPLHVDLTRHDALEFVEGLSFPSEAAVR
jgi:5'-nucleotidase